MGAFYFVGVSMSKELANMDSNDHLVEQIAALIENAKQHVVTVVNSTMIVTYYEIGRMIVEHEQKGASRAEGREGVFPRLGEGFDRAEHENFWLAGGEDKGLLQGAINTKSIRSIAHD